ncbi:hypothetical protein EFT68_15980 [Lactiplantibacillus plantarum]|nr:hypothetical protein [Lactiplantibacillus plantarum]MCT3551546.1 hypothetical protein [Lactiplantibacillus plantarum]
MSKAAYARKNSDKRKSGKSKAKLGFKYNISKGSPGQLPDHVKKYMISMKQLVGRKISRGKLRLQKQKKI